MKNESEFKSLFKRSVTRDKGFSLSLAAPMVVGIPDLFVAMPGYIPILLEAKWLGELKKDNFSRKVQFTAMQITWIESCCKINPYIAMGLIGMYYRDDIYAVLVAYNTPEFNQFTNSFLTNCSYSIRSKETKLFDVSGMFARVPIPKIENPDDATRYAEPLALPDTTEGSTTRSLSERV